jgi:beta propeller repeat protein
LTRSSRLRLFWCAIAVVLFHSPGGLHGQATITGTLRQLTTNAGSQIDPAVGGDIVVYTSNQNGNDDVYFMNVVTGVETRVTTSTTPQRLHDVSGGRIVYTDLTPPAARIRLYDIATASDTAISPGPDQNARIDGQIVVFERGSSSSTDVVAVNLDTNTETIVAGTAALELRPSVSGMKVVYERRAAFDGPSDIVLFDLAAHTETLVASGADNRRPDIDGNTIVWDTETADGSLDVAVYDVSTGQTRVLAMPGNQRFAHISGRFLSFDDDSAGNPDVAVYDLFSGAMKRVGGAAADFLNDISGNRMAFTSNASGNADIWVFEFQVVGDSLYGVSSEAGSFDDGLSVIAPATASAALVGPLDPDPNVFAQATGLSARPADKRLFAWNNWTFDPSGQIVFTGELLTVDACTGFAARVSPSTPPQGNLRSLVFAPDGSLFATSFEGLHRIDPATGMQTLVGSFGYGLSLKAINFVPDGTLYGAELTCGVAALGCPLPRIFTINPATGAATPVGTVSADVGRIDSLVFNPSTGQLLGNGDNGTGGRIFDLNTADATVSNLRVLVSSPTAGYSVPPAAGMAFAPSCLIGVAPTSLQFGGVEVGSSKSQIVTISNIGATAMSIDGVSLDPNGTDGFAVGPLSLPAALNPGASLDASVTFAPASEGAAASVLRASTTAGVVDLAVRGTGVPRPIPPSEQIVQLLQFFDDAVQTGTLTGSGQGNSSSGRLNALRNMLQAASDLIQQGATAQACQQLLDVLNRTDGNPQPPDLVTGPAAGELAAKVRSLRTSLGCP